MVPNRDEFFREVTLRICSSLQLNTALTKTFLYLRNFFPVHECFFQMLDNDLGAVRNLAYISAENNFEPTARNILPFPREIWDLTLQASKPYFVYRDCPDRKIRTLSEIVGLTTNQDLALPLLMDDEPIGLLVLRTKGHDRFTLAHAELLRVVTKPLSIALSNALAHDKVVRYRDLLIDDNRFLTRELRNEFPEDIIGANGGLRQVMRAVEQVAPLSNLVLILGETGTGKEVIANTIHYISNRSKQPFIKVNCGAIPEYLIDSELFGHEKGAFTGAITRKRGRFERANKGTLFLDEIGELPMQAQVRLLRVLQHNEIERIGSTQTVPVDVRIVAATHRNLNQMIAEKRFREDLWFRLNIFPIIIPPLRQRAEDIPELTKYFIARKSKKLGITIPPSLAPGALNRLISYEWPGNVRELENAVERELIRHRGGPVNFADLMPQKADRCMPEIPQRHLQTPKRLDDAIVAHIEQVLSLTQGKIHGPGGAAEMLQVNESTLRAKMKKLGIAFGRSKYGNAP